MHYAPPVDFPVASRRLVLGWILGLWVPGLVAIACWSWLAFPYAGLKWLGLVFMAAAAFVAVLACNRIVQGSLVWDGLNWAWTDGENRLTGEVALVLDLQRHVLLSFDSATAGPRRVWLILRGHGAHWTAMRRALCARRGEQYGGAKGPGAGLVDDFRRT